MRRISVSVVHGGALALVPEYRNRDTAGVARLGSGIGFMQEPGMVDQVGDDAGRIGECPAALQHKPVHNRHWLISVGFLAE